MTERLDYNKDERFHEEWNKKEEGNRRREKRIALFEIGKRKNMMSNSSRQDSWAKWQSATNLMAKKKKNKEEKLPLDERKLLTRLALRLELNGIQVDGETTIPSEMDVDPNTHPSRKHLMRKETSLAELLERPEIKDSLKNCNHVNWSLLEVAGVESELECPAQSEQTPEKDTKPILYGMIKGVMAKIYIDQGAQVSVISEAFVQSNAIGMSVLRNPVKLKMANGMIEPSFNKVHSVAFTTGDLEGKDEIYLSGFSEKINAFVAPLKGYDAIIGRDNLSRWQAILDLRSKEDIMKELEDKGIQRVIPRSPCDGLSVYDKKKKIRIYIPYGRNIFLSPEKMTNSHINDLELKKILESGKEVFLYEVLVEQCKEGKDPIDAIPNSSKEQSQEEKDLEKILKMDYESIMKDELPNVLPPDRGIRHYIKTQGRLPRQAPRGFRMSMAENEFMQSHIQNLLDKGLIIPTLGPSGVLYW